jgi:MFS family permease
MQPPDSQSRGAVHLGTSRYSQRFWYSNRVDYRKIALRVLLASLCVAALSGIAVLFIPSASHIIGRLVGTAILTAIASAFLLRSINAIESKGYRIVGLTAGVLICCIYISSAGAIWAEMIRSSDLDANLFSTAMLLIGCGTVILIGMAGFAHTRLALAGKVLVGLWLLILISWLSYIWFFSASSYPSDVFIYIVVPFQCFTVLIALILMHRRMAFRFIGIAFTMTSCIALQIGLLLTDGHMRNGDTYAGLTLLELTLITACISAQMAFWNIITYRKPSHAMPWCERATAVVILIANVSFCLLILHNEMDGTRFIPELLTRISIGFGILAPTALVALVIGRQIRANAFLLTSSTSLQATCPRCQKERPILQGKSSCCYCGHMINLKMEPSGCRHCQYDLTGCIDSGVCPECGTPIHLVGVIE